MGGVGENGEPGENSFLLRVYRKFAIWMVSVGYPVTKVRIAIKNSYLLPPLPFYPITPHPTPPPYQPKRNFINVLLRTSYSRKVWHRYINIPNMVIIFANLTHHPRSDFRNRWHVIMTCYRTCAIRDALHSLKRSVVCTGCVHNIV